MIMTLMTLMRDSLEHPGGLAAELVSDCALQQALHQAREDVGEVDLVTVR